MFLVEGALAVIVAMSFFFLPRTIEATRCLTGLEKEALHQSMLGHQKPVASAKQALLGAVRNPVVWVAGCGIKFFRDIGFYGLMYW